VPKVFTVVRSGHVPDRQTGNWRDLPVGKARRDSVSKHRKRLSWDGWVKLARLLISAIGPIAKLIDAISRIR
jgi:hypothetical protein